MSLALTCQYLLPNSHIYKALVKVSLLPYKFFLCNDIVQVQIHRQSLCKENSYDGIIISFHLNEEWSWIFLHSCEYSSSNTILLKEMRRRIQKRGGNCSLLSQVTWWSKTWLKISEPPLSQKFVWNFCANDEVKKSLIKK